MITPEESKSTPFIHRTTEYAPPKNIGHWLIGRPLQTADAPHQTIGKAIGLAVFSSDAMSSVAYGPQEMLTILAVAGTQALGYAFPLSMAIVGLLVILTLSYEQTIHAYPSGGGAYIVSRDNLGKMPALIAGASLLTDYILTVSVSVSSGVAQIVSAYPALFEYRAIIAVTLVLFIMLINLRGVKESGVTFAIPTYFFLIMIFITTGIGLFRYATGSLGVVVDPPRFELNVLHPITLFLILRAFSNGTTSLTGVEAISNGITAFKEPRSHNAGATLIWMSGILGTLLLGISFLSVQIGAVPSEAETVISQLARTVYGGRNFIYVAAILGTTLILVMAANTAFADFPRLSALVAIDGFLPRQLAFKGSRLVYSYGIVTLALIASGLIFLFNASVSGLIPLYAIGVFLSFTLSQSGMSHRWWKIGRLKPGMEIVERGSILHYDPKWHLKMIFNSVGAIATGMVMLIFAVTKFTEGAWVVLILIPALVGIFLFIHKHYHTLASRLSLENYGEPPPYMGRHRVIVPISNVHQGTLAALRYARMLSNDITAVYISTEPAETEKVQKKWETWGRGMRLVIVDSPYRLFLEPLLGYIEEMIANRQPNETITIVVPQFIPSKQIYNALHMRTADMLRKELLSKPDVMITDVPYQIP
ncbi:MAG: APC family permease [Chloroflexi bacterium]|nr:APC family permease [Chloroflexota bacterium]MBI3340412.1 APC family permease [Chloroflexota bacterium]